MRMRKVGCESLAIQFAGLAIALASLAGRAALAEEVGKAGVDDFYRSDQVQSVRLQIADEDLKRMVAALPKRIFVRGSFQWGKLVVDDVAIRFKGNSSSAPEQQHKRSFLIKFNEFESAQRFLGLRRVSLDNGVQFGSVFSEPIITDILREEGITSHRCNYARLYLNDKYYGVYVNVERIDESFLEQHLPDAKGLLFKVDQGGPGSDLTYLGDDPAAYGRAFLPESKSAKKGGPQLVEFIRMIVQTPAAEFAATLDAKLQTDAFLRTTAVLLFSGAFDQLTGWNPHNYYLYHDGKSGRWRYLPWDLDVGFCDNAFGRVKVLEEWNAAWPVAGQRPNPLMERIASDPELLKRYRAAAKIILEKYFEPEKLCAVIDAKYKLIAEDLKTDPFPHRRITNPGDRDYDDIVASMKRFVRARYASARQELENPGARPAMTPMAAGPQQFEDKIQRIMRGAQRMQQNGQSVLPIQRLMQQVGPLLQAGRMDEAGKLIDQALQLVGEDTPAYFPPPESQGGWRKLEKADDVRRLAGMDPQKLAALGQWLRKSDGRKFAAVVIRKGYVVLEEEREASSVTSVGNVKSSAKAICATVLAIASEESQQPGRTPRKMKFDDLAFDFIPMAQPLSDPRKAKITVRQLLNHTSGLAPESSGARNAGPWEYIMGQTGDARTAKLAFDPGSDLDYTTHGLYHASLVCENVTGVPYDRYATEHLFKPLGIERSWFEFFDGGERYGRHPSHGLGLPAREMARIAYCMAHEGRWGEQQVIPRWFVEETAHPTHEVKGKRSFGRDAECWSDGWEIPANLTDGRGKGIPKDARFKPGSGGQLIAFVPSLDLVVTRQTGGSGEWEFEEYLRLACEAVMPGERANAK